jgi:hypothetical protein
MSHGVCPWWLGYLLASPVRRLLQDPTRIVAPHVREGMTVLEPGPAWDSSRSSSPGSGTVLVAEPAGHVKAADFEDTMAAAARAGLRREPGPTIARSLTAVLAAA